VSRKEPRCQEANRFSKSIGPVKAGWFLAGGKHLAPTPHIPIKLSRFKATILEDQPTGTDGFFCGPPFRGKWRRPHLPWPSDFRHWADSVGRFPS